MQLGQLNPNYIASPIRSNNEIIIAPEGHEQERALMKHDADGDELIEFIKQPDDFESTNNTAAIDRKKDVRYVTGNESMLATECVNTKTALHCN